MKKVLLCAMALFCAVAVSAQTAEELAASTARLEKLAGIEKPKPCDLATIQALSADMSTISDETLKISTLLRALSENATDRVAALTQAKDLLPRVKAQTAAIENASKLIPTAGKELTTIKNPLKLKAPTKALSYAKKILPLVTAETVFQGKAVVAIIGKLTKK
ncbi:MAG: hypothetical protein RR182_03990 [Alistipes sp.]